MDKENYMDKEIWKIYKTTYAPRWGHRVYEVSNLGRVKINGVIITPQMWGNYYRLCGKHLHRIVAELFVPNPENKPCVDHINTDRSDNRAENLRWVTTKENNNNPLTKQHLSETQHGKVLTAEHKRKISEARKGNSNFKGKTHSEETKRKLSEALKDKPRKPLSEEHKRKLSEARKKKH